MALSKAEVCRAFREVMAADYADVPAKEEIDHVFSPEFYAKMTALIAEQKRGSWRLLSRQTRRALVVAAILAVSMLLVACTPNLREAVSELVVTVYETFVDFVVSEQPDVPLRTEIETVYSLTPIPDGFEIVSQERGDPYTVKTILKDKNDQRITVIQDVVTTFTGTVDSETGVAISKTISNQNILFLYTDAFCSARFLYDGYYFDITYYGTITLDEFEVFVSSICSAN